MPSWSTSNAAEREELLALGLDVAVQQHLLALGRRPRLGHRAALPRHDADPALGGVLPTLERPGVVPPAAVGRGHRQVGLLGARADLLEDGRAQRLEVGGPLVGPGVLGLEVRDHLRVVLVAQPLVGVDDAVAVVLADVLDPFGARRGRHGCSLVSGC